MAYIRCSKELHLELKVAAARAGISMQEFAQRVILREIRGAMPDGDAPKTGLLEMSVVEQSKVPGGFDELTDYERGWMRKLLAILRGKSRRAVIVVLGCLDAFYLVAVRKHETKGQIEVDFEQLLEANAFIQAGNHALGALEEEDVAEGSARTTAGQRGGGDRDRDAILPHDAAGGSPDPGRDPLQKVTKKKRRAG